MSVEFTRWMQMRLCAFGFQTDPDGLMGPGTRAALETFQRAKGLRATGTTTAETVEALRLPPHPGWKKIEKPFDIRPVWLTELERRQGLHELRDRSRLMAWLRSDGRTLGDPAKLPWCGDAIQTAIALTLPHEPQIANPYLARNWLKFGSPTKPRLGAVMVFRRGNPEGTSGHVALYVGADDTHYHVIGGNQSNAVTVTRVAKDRLLGARWPATSKLNTEAVRMAASGEISTNEA